MVEIVETVADYKSVSIKLETGDDRTFYMRVSPDGISFYSDYRSITGTSGEIAVTLSADEIFELIGKKGDKKPFRDRVGVQPKLPNSPSANKNPFAD